MAVFTKLDKEDIVSLLKDYSIGKILSYKGIVEGIENSNYKITTKKNNYILTIFEKRVNPIDLPFFIDLQKHLSMNGFQCPNPIENNSGKIINYIYNKNAVLISFLEGKQIVDPKPLHCEQVGRMIGEFFNITSLFNQNRENTMGLKNWKEIFFKFKDVERHKYTNLIDPMQKELIFLESHWPNKLPMGIIHADLFKDNIFFNNDKLTGVIDFYFACSYFKAYELAIATNAWCFDLKNGFIKENFQSLIAGYNEYFSLTKEEKNNFNTLLRGAAIRILVTRMHDSIFHDEKAIIVPKNPDEYFSILKWHQENSIFD
ncbi:MAG: Homoserine kinase [Alphaproteobacteria bacterium MarineAlpha5_Bin5]|nr:MAG: Homoserine kinase [Alphaproteobacteria bacterium MarineAlpha5_Bin5]PPR51697.1 MAG: Homoserine kinase [Alphaproteobacteria bacterium MarineAlpha5_Bin4]|tara:strand:- start:222 stop:1169 length:948 start_codon:yes stop_codon:yes gene_type:complete